MDRRSALVMAAGVGFLLALPLLFGGSMLAEALGFEDSDGMAGFAALFAFAVGVLAWLLLVASSLVVWFAPRAEGRVFRAWMGVLGIASLAAGAYLLGHALPTEGSQSAFGMAVAAAWTVVAGLVALLWLPQGGRMAHAGPLAR